MHVSVRGGIQMADSIAQCVVAENIHTPPHEGFFWYEPPTLLENPV